MFRIEKAGKTNSVTFYCSSDEFSGVKKIAAKVAHDVKLVTGAQPQVHELKIPVHSQGASSAALVLPVNSVIFATLGKSALAEKIASQMEFSSLVKVSSKIRGKREVYIFAVTKERLIILGSDKRGTIYGLFHLSELMGVSPFVDWADVLPVRQNLVKIEEGVTVSREPSVRFRGFFINDEWPAFGNWCKKNYGGFNAKMYEHVFELLLRLKGNYLWPAMWASRFSDDGPGLKNAELADELGVIMGASHHEPCCRAGEEYKHLRGPDSIYGDAWNFRTNREGITKFWEDGLKRNGKFENVITVGMRGEADTAILKNATLKDNINLLRDVLKTQNHLIRQYVNNELEKVPRMLALYKEVEPYFYGDRHTKGLMNSSELEGVTLMLCDDNHGNLRTVPTEKMRSHNGGYGMYYHLDYHGWPYSYEWMNTTHLSKIKEQMTAAYDFGIRELWIVNVGDIMSVEFPLNYFLDLAYNFDTYSLQEFTVAEYTRQWVDLQFAGLSSKQKDEIFSIINEYTKLAHLRRTEALNPETFNPINFNEADKILSRVQKVIELSQKLRKKMPSQYMPVFFEQVYCPACGTMNVLKMQLFSGKNLWFAKKGAIAANYYAQLVKECYDFDKKLVNEADRIAGGKFFAMCRSEHFGFASWCEAENHYPVYAKVEPTRKNRAIVWIDGNEKTTSGQDWTDKVLFVDAFKNPLTENAYVKIASCNEKPFSFEAALKNGEKSFLSFEVQRDKKTKIDTIKLSVNREKLLKAKDKIEQLLITGNDGQGAAMSVSIIIDAEVPVLNYPKGTFVQTTNYISIEAQHFVKQYSGANGAVWRVLPDYGKTLSAVKVFPDITVYPKAKNAPYVEYSFALANSGVMSFDFYLNPSNPAYKDNRLSFVAEVDGEKILKEVVDSKTFAVGDNQEPWGRDVTNNIRIASVYADCKAGLNTLKVYPVTPNLVLEKIVIHDANTSMIQSYLGAPETYVIQ